MTRLTKLEVLVIGPTSRVFNEDDVDDDEDEDETDFPLDLEESDDEDDDDEDDQWHWLTNLYSSGTTGRFKRPKMQQNSELRWIAQTWPKLRFYSHVDSDEGSSESDLNSDSDSHWARDSD